MMSMKRDLVVLVPDRNTEATIEGLLARQQSLRIRPIEARILVHPEKDPGCRLHGHELLRIHQREYEHALMVFDRVGCGAEQETRSDLESAAERKLSGRLEGSKRGDSHRPGIGYLGLERLAKSGGSYWLGQSYTCSAGIAKRGEFRIPRWG